MGPLLTILFSFFLALPCWAGSSVSIVERLNKTFAPNSKLMGSYNQERFVKSLGVTLNSSGKFNMKKNGGITWEQTKPFASTLHISEKEISFAIEGSPPRIVSPETDPALYSFGRAFLTLLKGEDSALKSQFDVSEVNLNRNWTMRLAPKNDLIKKIIRTIRIDGNDFVKNVRIEDQSDNFMKIDFKDIQILGSPKR